MLLFAKFMQKVNKAMRKAKHPPTIIRLIEFSAATERHFNDIWNGRRTKEWNKKANPELNKNKHE